MTHRGLATAGLLLAAVLLLVPTATAQLPTDSQPEVAFEDVTVEEPIPPGGAPVPVALNATVGCTQDEPPETENTATIVAVQPPAGVTVDIEPPTTTWTNSAGDCGPDADPQPVNATATLRVQNQVPALTPVSVDLQMTVEKAPPVGEAETYGPYNASVTVTPDYLGRFSVSLEENTAEVPANQTATFTATVENTGNGETQITASLEDVDDSLVTEGTGEALVLPAGEEGTVTIEIGLVDTGIDSLSSHTIELVLEGQSTDPDGGSAGNETRTLTARFQPTDDGSFIPGPGAGLLVLIVSLSAAVLRRR